MGCTESVRLEHQYLAVQTAFDEAHYLTGSTQSADFPQVIEALNSVERKAAIETGQEQKNDVFNELQPILNRTSQGDPAHGRGRLLVSGPIRCKRFSSSRATTAHRQSHIA
jgi:hypothetical protein